MASPHQDGKNPDMSCGVYQGHQGEWINQESMKGDLKGSSDCSNQVYIHTKRSQKQVGFT